MSFSTRIFYILLAGTILLLLAHIFGRQFSPLFDLDLERNLGSLYSALLLVISTALCLMIAWVQQLAGKSFKTLWQWYSGAVLFGYVTLDELWSLHETVGAKLNTLFHLWNSPRASFNWVEFFAPLAVVGVIVLVSMMKDACHVARVTVMWFLWGIFSFIAVLAVEWGSGQWLYDSGRAVGRGWWYWQAVILEEGLEMIGVSFIVIGLWLTLQGMIHTYWQVKF